MQCILNVLVFKCLAPQQEKESEWKKEDSVPLNPQPMGVAAVVASFFICASTIRSSNQ